MHHLFFDVEWDNNENKQIIWLAYELWGDGKCVERLSTLVRGIRPARITNAAYQIHGVTEHAIQSHGVPLLDAMDMFIRAATTADAIVAHGIEMDMAAIINHSFEVNMRFPANKLLLCTKLLGTEMCRLPHIEAGLKWPTLQELHTFLFGVPFEGWHNAECDVAACRDCFFRVLEIDRMQSDKTMAPLPVAV
jgi:hypothetical protein